MFSIFVLNENHRTNKTTNPIRNGAFRKEVPPFDVF